LDYAERGPIALGEDLHARGVDTYDSFFEEDVVRQIRSLGWEVDTQVGVSRYRIDIGVRHPEYPGKYLAGVECDGATYHSAETARDRDIGRQEALERRGWSIYRIWSTDWFRDKGRVLDDLQVYFKSLLDDGDSTSGAQPSRSPPSPHPRVHLPVFRQLERGLEPGTIPYSGLSGGANQETYTSWLMDKLRHEGPWERAELGQIARGDYWIRELMKSGLVTLDGNTLWHRDSDRRTVIVKVFRNGTIRDFDAYSDEEILRAMELACHTSVAIKREEVARATARLLGYSRTAPSIRHRIDNLLPRAFQEGYLKVCEKGVQSQPEVAFRFYSSLSAIPETRIPEEPAETAKRAPPIEERSSSTAKPSRSLTTNLLTSNSSLFNEALKLRRPLRIRYRDGNGVVTARIVEVQGVGGVYFDAFDHRSQAQRTFRMDRVLSATWSGTSTYRQSSNYRPSKWVAGDFDNPLYR
jgi:very-short-patch-repair endonuclease